MSLGSYLLLLSFFFFFSCFSFVPLDEPKSPKKNYWQNYSEFLAGIQSHGNNPEFEKHRKEMDEAWQRIDRETRNTITQFLQREGIGLEAETVLYPFSGMDVLNLFSFFPNAKVYVCFGLESAQSMDHPPPNLDEETRNFKSIQNLSKFLATRNYFTYKIMREEIQMGQLQGALPVYLAFLTRMGYQVRDVEKISSDRYGTKEKVFGFRIHFLNPKTSKKQRLDYWKLFLPNGDPLGRDIDSDPLAQYFLQLGQKAVFQKSAEYLLHGESRKPARDLFLKDTFLIVQDDSGFPLKYFPETQWQRKIYGKFQKSWNLPGANTPEAQPELLAFRDQEPLPFPFGYGVLSGKTKQESILIILKNDSKLLTRRH